MFKIATFKKSLKYALRGLALVAREEQNFRIQIAVAAAAILLALVLRLSRSETAVVAISAGFVLVLELLNSIVERMVDLMQPRVHHYVEEVKDIMAGAVLVSAVAAVVVGAVVFGPRLLALIR